jgi:hypothetical protein
VALVRTDISVEIIASIIMVTRISDLETVLARSSNSLLLTLFTLMMEAILSSGTSALTKATRRLFQKTAFLNFRIQRTGSFGDKAAGVQI